MFVNLGLGTNREFVDPRTASLGVKSSKRNRELENSASLGPRVCEVLLYKGLKMTCVSLPMYATNKQPVQ